jgi:hypothetical protein
MIFSSWDFYSEESDIAFAIYHKKGKDELVPIVSSERVDCHVSPEEGEIRCEEPGTCNILITHLIN